MINIKQLEPNQTFDSLYTLINSVEKKYTAEGKMFLDFTLQDMSGNINAKLWSATEEDFETLESGKVVEVSGDVTVFRKENQIRIKKISIYEGMDVGHFLPAAPIELDELKEGINQYILQIENPIISNIVIEIVDRYETDLFTYPAASKNHHEYIRGLAHHILSMLKLSEFVCDSYDNVNRDLLYAGVILHDFGKVIELSGIVSTEYTTVGKLIGHINIATTIIHEVALKHGVEDSEEVMLLQHMVLAHHGKLEYGSPKVPGIVEAEVLNLIDNLDARLNMLDKSLCDVEEGEFSPRIFPLESRRFYKHNLSKKI